MTPTDTAADVLVDLTRFFARRTALMTSWTTFSEDKELISLAGGLPDTSLFGADLHAELLAHVAHEHSAQALQYGPTPGLAATKQCVLQVMAAERTPVEADGIIITTGGQQALDLLCRVLLDPGDVVITEAPTYPGVLLPLAAHEASVVQIPTDDDGLRTDLLADAIERLRAEGRVVKFVYCVPNYQNPSGRTLSLERRRHLLEIARRFDLPVIEDNPYGLLRLDAGEGLPTLRSLDTDGRVLYVGTFSKILGPGLRVGWLAAPPEVLAKVDLGKQCADLCTPSTSQLLVAAYFATGQWRGYLDRQVEVYRERRNVMLDCLAEIFPDGTRWTMPAGGLFTWVTLPDRLELDTWELFQRAATRSVSFVPGRVAYASPRPMSRELRLNFSAQPADRIAEGMRRLAATIAEMTNTAG